MNAIIPIPARTACHTRRWRPACASALHLSLPLVFAGLLLRLPKR